MDSDLSSVERGVNEVFAPNEDWRREMTIRLVQLGKRIKKGEEQEEKLFSEVATALNQLEEIDASSADDTWNDMSDEIFRVGEELLAYFLQNMKVSYIDLVLRCRIIGTKVTPQGDSTLPPRLFSVGRAYQLRFGVLGQQQDVEGTIEYYSQAISLMPDDYADLPGGLNNLGMMYRNRFEWHGKMEDYEAAIKCLSRGLSLLPEDHPQRPRLLNNLGNSHWARFELFGEMKELQEAANCYTQGASLAPEDSQDMRTSLGNLGNTHISRFEQLGQVEDIEKAIEYHSRVVSLIPEGGPNLAQWLSNLGMSHRHRFERLGILEDIDKAIECLSQAVSSTSEDDPSMGTRLNNLGISHLSRFERFGRLEDIDITIQHLSRAVSLAPESRADTATLLNNLGSSHLNRFRRLSKMEDIERAIQFESRAVSLTPDTSHPLLPLRLSNLSTSHFLRFEHLGQMEDVVKAIELQSRAVELTPQDFSGLPLELNNLGIFHLGRYQNFSEEEDINKSIEYMSRAVSLTPKGHTHLPLWFQGLGTSYRFRFIGFGNLEDLRKSIECHTQSIDLTPEGHVNLAYRLHSLGMAYKNQYQKLGSSEALAHAIDVFHRSAILSIGSPKQRFDAALQWVKLAHVRSSSETLLAFQTAIDLIPHIVWLGETIAQRYDDVRRIGNLATEAAAAAISAGQYHRAIEWLEQGRSVVWNQTLQLRTPFNELSSVNPGLADELRDIAVELHGAASRTQGVIAQSNTETSPEQAAQRHRRLAEQYEKLLDKIRSIDGFGDFLRPKKASELVRAARTGPVVVVNVHQLRCDALILLPDQSEIGHVPLRNLSTDKAHNARMQLQHSLHGLRERGVKVASKARKKDGGISDALNILWTDVVEPVLNYLQYEPNANSAGLPHITWCATGPLSFLPLHAAGRFTQPQAKLFDYAISSYTPTLGALISSPLAPLVKHSSILTIGQENTPGHNPLPMTTIELAQIENHILPPLRYTKLDGDNATPDLVLAEMAHHDWIHLACHAHQDRKVPVESAFILHQGELSLARIMQKSFTNKGLAFLSACQTAQGDEELPDEAVHLASGMLLAGYPSIIATMWSVVDEDAPVIAERVYAEMVRDGEMDYTKAARALHFAVKELRERVGETEFGRWVPYIHIGV